ncbi:MAG: nucleotidyl transferase AbiEii/AbiGii toxin family protein [Candidatus Kerfeldbacteria bacterium]|nr:nucleotidyl transferase AbiEii/AbiGii toxin family protein [Candidatus Kerfeldbacteria bacterium]
MTPDILTPEQKHLLEKIGQERTISERFYLTGGTALAGFYLHHRYSEDLDFFSEQEVDAEGLSVFFHTITKEFQIRKIDFEQSFNRNLFFLTFPSGILKAEFTYFPFPRLRKGATHAGVTIDSLEDIGVNKLFTIYQRTKARDYIDLYCICKKQGYTIHHLVMKARAKFDTYIDPLQLGTQFVKASEAQDLPRMIQKVPSEDWQQFFIEEAKRLKSEVVE